MFIFLNDRTGHCLTGNAVQRKRVLASVRAGCDLEDPCRGGKNVILMVAVLLS